MKLFKTLWGVENLSDKATWPATIARIKADGFDGVEVCVGPMFPFGPHGSDDEQLALQLLRDAGLQIICQLHTDKIGGRGYPIDSFSVDDHIASFKERVLIAATLKPILINSHSGKDSFTTENAIKFFSAAEQFVAENKNSITCPVLHETHRSRILYSAVRYRDLMPHLPASLQLTADLSHFCVVAERVLDDKLDADFWPEVLADVTKRARLIHARVGSAQTPQVATPFDPAHADEVASHMRWWRLIAAGMKARGVEVVMEPEFGGTPYLPRLPFTQQPVVDVWAVNTEFGKKLREEFGKEF